MAKEDFTVTFVTLFSLTWFAGVLTGSTLQWVIGRGLFKTSWKDKNNRYNIIVFIAAVSAGLLSPFNFFSYYLAPDGNFGYSVYLLLNWMVMTHSSVVLVSAKLCVTYRDPELAFRRLLLINVAMVPVSLLVCVTWGGNYNTDKEIFHTLSKIIEPIQMSLWGLIEFVLSGMFIVKMWKYNWTTVERQGIFVLVLVGICDIASVVSNVILGDYESTVVKAFVYCLRIRLEIGVLCTMADFLSKKSRASVYQHRQSKASNSRFASKDPNCNDDASKYTDSNYYASNITNSNLDIKQSNITNSDIDVKESNFTNSEIDVKESNFTNSEIEVDDSKISTDIEAVGEGRLSNPTIEEE